MGREMIWEQVIGQYANSFGQAQRERMSNLSPGTLFPGIVDGTLKLPSIKLDHLLRLTDSTGIVQHARYHLPYYAEGYCTDDNARALILTMLLREMGHGDSRLDHLADTYMAFLNYAYTPEHRQFRNFMGYDRQWLESVGSEDSSGRAIWALGTCIGRTDNTNARTWAMSLMEQVLPSTLDMQSPRAWAFALLGIYEYLKRFPDDRMAKSIRQQLVDKLVFRFTETATADWIWFENALAYDNAVLPHALLISGYAP
jgi:hypothetical protein